MVLDEGKVKRLVRTILLMEGQNLRKKDWSDPKMVEKIKEKIEEEVKCYSKP